MTTRRAFVADTATGLAGLVIGFHLPIGVRRAGPPAEFRLNAYLSVAPDGVVTIWVPRLELGQGVRTSLAMVVAEELDVAWSAVRVQQAQPGGAFAGVQLHTSGSDSSRDTFTVLRTAGASARAMLVGAAAGAWGVDAASCATDAGEVVHAATSRRAAYGTLVSDAARQPAPSNPPLKPASAYRIVSHPTPRVGARDIVTGAARYGADRTMPGLLHASIERAPRFGATMASFNRDAVLAMPGVRAAVVVTSGIHAGVAIVADDPWTAMQARRALRIEWRGGVDFDSAAWLASLPERLRTGRRVPVRHDGPDPGAAPGAERIAREYLFPFQAHAAVEPLNATAHVTADRAELWVPTQTDVRTFDHVAKVTGLPRERITLHCTDVGGGFGRRLFADFAAEAAEVSKAVGAPIQVQWTRADDMRHGYFQPATIQRLEATLSPTGAVTSLSHLASASDLTIFDIHEGRNIWTAPPKAAKTTADYTDGESPWGAYDHPYAVPSLRIDCVDVTSPVPTGPWRAVEYPATVFARESFLDECAASRGIDPIDFRLALLPAEPLRLGRRVTDRMRLARVLARARELSRWGTPVAAPPGMQAARGVATSVYFAQSYIAMVAEVHVARDLSDLRVSRITTVVDCGLPVNPLGIEGQTESAIAWGLTATLFGKMDFRGGAAVQSSYADYRVMRIDRMPRIETVIIAGDDRPGGYGEHAVPLVAPAVANAVAAACGRRVRSLPITPAAMRAAAKGPGD